MSPNAFESYLRDRWRTNIFAHTIFPMRSFRRPDWIGGAFNRDRQGNQRLPSFVWEELLSCIRMSTSESVGFVCCPDLLVGGTTAERSQPFVVGLTKPEVLTYFSDMNMYLPEFQMAGACETWGIWGNSDLTVFGGQRNLIAPALAKFGGKKRFFEVMCEDFGVAADEEDPELAVFLMDLLEMGRDANVNP